MAKDEHSSSVAACRACLVGQFGLRRPDGEPFLLQGRRARALLAYLLLAPGQTANREKLANLCWGDRAEAQARASLRQCLHHLKTALSLAGDELIDVSRETVSLTPGAFDCDAVRLSRELGALSCEEAVRRVEEAGVGILLEDLDLPGEFGDWLDLERGRFDAGLGAGLSEQIVRCEDIGNWVAVKALATAWQRRDPLNEAAVAALIRSEIAAGAMVAAHRHYNSFRELLAAELGVEPGPMVEAAMRTVSESTAAVAKTAPVTRIDPVVAKAAQEIVLAVLAFENQSSDPELMYFCDGISDEIQCTVARGSDLKVVARASSFQMRGTELSVAEVGEALGATHLLYGSVRRGGKQVRISAELVESAGANSMWADRFDGDLDDIFALQEGVAEKVAQALKVALSTTSASPKLTTREYETFLRARGLLAESDPQYDDGAAEALPLLEALISDVPDFAPAWEQLAIARAEVFRARRDKRDYTKAREEVFEAAKTALRLDPHRVGARRALAMMEPWGDFKQREQLLRMALDLAPNDPAVLTDISQFYWGVGRFRDALPYAEKACELNPLMPAARLQVAQLLIYTDDYEGSMRMHKELRKRWPLNPGIMLSLISAAPFLGDWKTYDEVVGDSDSFAGWQAADMRATRIFNDTLRSRDPDEIAKRVKTYASVLDKTGTLPVNLIVSIAALGRVDQALDLAERASYDHIFTPDGHRPSAYWPGTLLGRWSAVIQSPRFVKLCARLGLCDYWVETDQWPDCVEWAPYDFKAEARKLVVNNPQIV